MSGGNEFFAFNPFEKLVMKTFKNYDTEPKSRTPRSSTTNDLTELSFLSRQRWRVPDSLRIWATRCSIVSGIAAIIIEFALLVTIFYYESPLKSSFLIALVFVGVFILALVIYELIIPIVRVSLAQRRVQAKIQARLSELVYTEFAPCAPTLSVEGSSPPVETESGSGRIQVRADEDAEFQKPPIYSNPIERYLNSASLKLPSVNTPVVQKSTDENI